MVQTKVNNNKIEIIQSQTKHKTLLPNYANKPSKEIKKSIKYSQKRKGTEMYIFKNRIMSHQFVIKSLCRQDEISRSRMFESVLQSSFLRLVLEVMKFGKAKEMIIIPNIMPEFKFSKITQSYT